MLKLRTFNLVRHEDVTGLSGTGIVAVGVVFPNGQVVFQWCTYRTSMEIYSSVDNLIEIHGHSGKTEVVFTDVCGADEKPKKAKKKKEIKE